MVKFSLSGGGVTIPLSEAIDPSWIAARGLAGMGLVAPTPRWFDGAGEGSRYRGARRGRRVMTVPLVAGSRTEAQLQHLLDDLGIVLADTAVFRVDFGSESWWVEVVHTGGGDFAWGPGTNGRTFLKMDLTLEAGDPYWTREDAEQMTVQPVSSARGLLRTGPLTALRLSTSQAQGAVRLANSGNAPAWPVIILEGPASSLTVTGPQGYGYTWSGELLAGQRRYFDHRARMVTADGASDRRYTELGPAPRFWPVPPRESTAQVEVVGADSGTLLTISWRPRRRAVV